MDGSGVALTDVDVVAIVDAIVKPRELVTCEARYKGLIDRDSAIQAEIQQLNAQKTTPATAVVIDKKLMALHAEWKVLRGEARVALAALEEARVPYADAVAKALLPHRAADMGFLARELDQLEARLRRLNEVERLLMRAHSPMALVPWIPDLESCRGRLRRFHRVEG